MNNILVSDFSIEPTALINIDAFHYENTYKRLCPSESGKSKREAVFPTMWELFVWATILGYLNHKPKPIEKRYPSPPFRWQMIKEPHQKLLMIMAVEKEKTFEILKTPDELKKNFEEHSNGGMDIIQRELACNNLAYKDVENLIFEIQKRFTK